MPFKEQKDPHVWDNHYPGLPLDWNFLVLQALERRDISLSIRGLGLFLASIGVFVFFALFVNDRSPSIVFWLPVAGIFAFPVSLTWMKKELDWQIQQREAAATLKEPRVIEVIHLVPFDRANPEWRAYRKFVYHHHKNGNYVGTMCWQYSPQFVERLYSEVGSTELQAVCSACNTLYKCVRIPWGDDQSTNVPGCTYWLGPHENCPKFPYHPEYDVDKSFGHHPTQGNTHKLDSVEYLNHSHLPGAPDPFWDSSE
jgi:hypothetical protein